MTSIDLECTEVFEKNWIALHDDSIRFVKNEGGSRSSKSVSLSQMAIMYCLENEGVVVSVVRKTLNSLKSSLMRDLIKVLKDSNLYLKQNHNKTEHIYTFGNGSFI